MNSTGRVCLLCVIAVIIVLTLVLIGGIGDIEKLQGSHQNTSGFARIQIPFIENQGQAPEEVAYYAQTHGGPFYVTGDGAMVLALPGNKNGSPGATITERIMGNSRITPRGRNRAETQVNIYSGSQPDGWRKSLPSYNSLDLTNVYDGIELELKSYGNNIEKIFRVHPHKDPSIIRVSIEGILEVDTGEKGDLVAHTPYGPVTYSPPVAYQEVEGDMRSVEVAYVVEGTSYGFQVGEYDRNLDLVIDPLLQSTYVGGMGGDSVEAVLIHPTSGKVYICGSSSSTGFGPLHLSQTDSDAYVARLNAALTSFEQITRLEGSGNDSCQDLRLDAASDRLFILGTTASSDFPVINAAQADPGGGSDTFVAYLDADLTLGSATYLGGDDLDNPVDMALDGTTGDLYLVGDTQSDDFPTTAGAPQPSLSGTTALRDAYVVRYNNNLEVQMATYLGGSLYEDMGAISIHPASGDIYVAGSTNSTNLPNRTGGAQPTNHGVYDAFVARYNSDLTTLVQTSYIGGDSGSESEVSMEIHPSTGKIFLTGLTNSRKITSYTGFPVVNAVQSTFGGLPTDLFVAVFDATLTTIEAATYLGGNNLEEGFPGNMLLTPGGVYIAARSTSTDLASTDFATGGLFVASFSASLDTLNRNVYVGGFHGSGLQIHPSNGDLYLSGDSGTGLPGTEGGAQASFGGGTTDVFLMRLNPDLTSIRQATYLGGADNDVSSSIFGAHLAFHPLSGNVYIVGKTGPVGLNSYVGDFPGTDGGAQESYGGAMDGFVAYFDSTLATHSATDVIIDFGSGNGIWTRYNDTTWTQLHKLSPEIIATGDLDGNGQDDCIIDFGASDGIWVLYNNTNWTKLHSLSPEIITTGDLDGNGQDESIFDFGTSYGIWVLYNNSTWTQLHKLSPEIIATGDLDGNGQDECIIDFGAANGIWVLYNNTNWTQLHSLSPEIIAIGDGDGNGQDDCAMDFGSGVGIWVWGNNAVWGKLHSLSPEIITGGDLDGNGLDEVIMDFGPGVGIWILYNNTTWTQLHGLSADIIKVGDLDASGADEIIVDFGASYGIYVLYNNTTWAQLHSLSPESIITGNIDGN